MIKIQKARKETLGTSMMNGVLKWLVTKLQLLECRSSLFQKLPNGTGEKSFSRIATSTVSLWALLRLEKCLVYYEFAFVFQSLSKILNALNLSRICYGGCTALKKFTCFLTN